MRSGPPASASAALTALPAQIEIGRGNLDQAERLLAQARPVDPEARLANWVEGLLGQAKAVD